MDPKVDFFLGPQGPHVLHRIRPSAKKSRSRILPRPNLSSASLSAIPTILLPNRWYHLISSWSILFTFTFQKNLVAVQILRKSVGVDLPSSQDESLKLHPSGRLALASPGWTFNFPSPLLTCHINANHVRFIIIPSLTSTGTLLFKRFHQFFLTSKMKFWTILKFSSTSTSSSSNFNMWYHQRLC